MNNKIQLFEGKEIRHTWVEEEEKWYFSVVDVVGALTEQATQRGASTYWAVLKKRLISEGANELLTNCKQLKMVASDGKKRLTDAGDLRQIFRIIQSIPSPKAEPIKQWLAKVGAERVDEVIDPELAIERAKATYLAKGYSPVWVTQRMQGIKTRNELTDEWRKRGVKESKEFATLTSILHKEAFDVTIKQHKAIKGLKKENLRDNMTTLETALTMLAEASATELERTQDPKTMSDHKGAAKAGGAVAKAARLDIEKRTGKKVVSAQNAKDLILADNQRASISSNVKEK